MRAIKVCLEVFDLLGIDISERLSEGRLLDPGELDALADYAGLTQEGLDALSRTTEPKPVSRSKVIPLESVRMGTSTTEQPSHVGVETKAIRLMYIRNYLAWLARRKLLRVDPMQAIYPALSANAQVTIEQLSARIPTPQKQDDLNARQSLTPEVRARVLDVIRPDSPENPWKNEHVRIRNQLIFTWLVELGLRQGEFLGVRLEDIDLRVGEVQVMRRADDPDEPRKDEPRTKGKARLLALSEQLAALTMAYVQGPRRSIKGARNHPYLVVATGTGKPLSKSALSKMFAELRRKVPGLPEELSPHLLRHTWNFDFSELMDRLGVPPEKEEQMRRQQMGWSDRSQTAAVYTRRHTRLAANKASLAMQAASFHMREGEQ